MTHSNKHTMKVVVWSLVLLLLILHQDNWLWHNDTLVFGFMPIGLLYHAGISIGASLTWLLAVTCAWPAPEEDPAAQRVKEGGPA